MLKKIMSLYRKHEEIINYLIVGVLTTIVSWLAYAACKLYGYKSGNSNAGSGLCQMGSRSPVCIFYEQKICI